MSRPEHFGWHQNSDGSYNQDKIGTDEAQRGWSPTPQQHNEDRAEAQRRQQAFDDEQRRMEDERRRQERQRGSSW